MAREKGNPNSGHLMRDNPEPGSFLLASHHDQEVRTAHEEGEYLEKVPGSHDQSQVMARVLCSANLVYNNLVKESKVSPPV